MLLPQKPQRPQQSPPGISVINTMLEVSRGEGHSKQTFTRAWNTSILQKQKLQYNSAIRKQQNCQKGYVFHSCLKSWSHQLAVLPCLYLGHWDHFLEPIERKMNQEQKRLRLKVISITPIKTVLIQVMFLKNKRFRIWTYKNNKFNFNLVKPRKIPL